MNAVIAHLWSSTLVLLVALILARVLPLTARTRYALLICALAKFAIPAIAITAPLRLLGIDLANLGRDAREVINIEWIGTPITLGEALPSQAISPWPEALLIGWVVSAAAFAAAWAIARRRLVSAALKSATEASPRERSALAAARLRLELSSSVDVVRSTICEAPAVVRIIRPVVVLPDGSSDELDDEELEALLRHECAHVARRDNLLGLFESAVVAAFWFHPLVWVAQRAIATTREEACDETAAATSSSIEAYVSALSKVCRSVVAPRLAGVSCMASAYLKERLNHLMKYETLRRRALSHRLVVGAAAIAVVAVAAATALHGSPSEPKDTPFQLEFTVRPGDLPDRLDFAGRVRESSNGLVIARPNVTFTRKSSATIRTVADGRDIFLEIRDDGSEVHVLMSVSRDGVPLQKTKYSVVPEADSARDSSGRRYTGAPMTLNLKEADIRDVLKMFAQLTNMDIRYSPDLEGEVTLNVSGVPWDQAFDLILGQNNLTYEINGKTIVVKEK